MSVQFEANAAPNQTIKTLTADEVERLEQQNSRLVPEFQAKKIEADAQRHWDLFYKRNQTNFFKDRHWTTREFEELLLDNNETDGKGNKNEVRRKTMLEVGCGVGNLIFPLIEDKCNDYFIYACDFSPRAVQFVQDNPLYDETNMKAFQCDITTDRLLSEIPSESLDIVTMIFVLSAIHPDKFEIVFKHLFSLIRPGGVLLFRDYGLYDMAQIRFKPGHKISENFYMRQDGTRSYYFTIEELEKLAAATGFHIQSNEYVYRRTVNIKENIDSPRTFVQSKFIKPK